MIATAREGEMVDEICWRVLGRTAAITEQVLERNRGLSDLGPRLPGGTQIDLPQISELISDTRETVKLWD